MFGACTTGILVFLLGLLVGQVPWLLYEHWTSRERKMISEIEDVAEQLEQRLEKREWPA